MSEFFRNLFASDFMPHGYCMRWSSGVIWLHVVSDLLTAVAYYVIPFALIYLVRRRKDLAFNWMFIAFGIFILSCGATHLMAVVTLWNPVYRIDGVIKAVTALSSVATAVALIRIMPMVLRIPSPEQLRVEIAQRKSAEEQLTLLNADLERRVQERTAALERYNAALERVAYISSHDLREPLRTVASFTQLLANRYRSALDQTGQEFVDYIVSGAKKMSGLIDGLLKYTEAVHDAKENLEPVSLNEALRGALVGLEAAVAEAGATIESGEMPEVMARPIELQQVFQNLLSNSLKYRSPDRPLRFSVSAERRGDRVMTVVADNGIGFDMKYEKLIFQAFKRLHGNEMPGDGLGLAICHSIVESFGGRISVASKPGEGTAFYVELPAATAPPIVERRASSPSISPDP